jgi:hypothetical protein
MHAVELTVTPVPPDVLQQAVTLANQLQTLLQPYLEALTPEQRKSLPKMADKTVAFVDDALQLAQANPQFAPSYLNVEQLQTDVNSVDNLNLLEQPLNSLAMQLNDTIMIAGSDAYIAALMFYNSVKEAARRNMPGAKAIYDELKKRFEVKKPAAPQA